MTAEQHAQAVRPECVGFWGQVFGHRMVRMMDFKATADVGMICSRCGLAVWRPTLNGGGNDVRS